ncbi:MAG: PAS domain-containing protein, partial [Acidimicrobiales bacterium]
QDVVGGALHRLFPSHLRDEIRSLGERVMAGERIQHFETEIVRSDGLPMPIWLSLSPIPGTTETMAGALVVARDITEQRLAQATLAELVGRMDEGESLAHVGSWLWDRRTGAVQWSTEFHRIHGVEPERFAGTLDAHLDLIFPADRELVREAMEESVVSRTAFELRYRASGPRGEERTVLVRAQPSIGSAGVAVGLRGVGQLVSDPTTAPGS